MSIPIPSPQRETGDEPRHHRGLFWFLDDPHRKHRVLHTYVPLARGNETRTSSTFFRPDTRLRARLVLFLFFRRNVFFFFFGGMFVASLQWRTKQTSFRPSSSSEGIPKRIVGYVASTAYRQLHYRILMGRGGNAASQEQGPIRYRVTTHQPFFTKAADEKVWSSISHATNTL